MIFYCGQYEALASRRFASRRLASMRFWPRGGWPRGSLAPRTLPKVFMGWVVGGFTNPRCSSIRGLASRSSSCFRLTLALWEAAGVLATCRRCPRMCVLDCQHFWRPWPVCALNETLSETTRRVKIAMHDALNVCVRVSSLVPLQRHACCMQPLDGPSKPPQPPPPP